MSGAAAVEETPVPPEMAQQLSALETLSREHPAQFEAFCKATEDMAQLREADPAAFERFVASEALQKQYGQGLAEQLEKREAAAPPLGGLQLPGGAPGVVLGDKGTQKAPQGKRVVPEPGFVVKTRCLADAAAEEASGGVGLVARVAGEEARSKVFVNLCVSEAIAKPRMVKRLAEDGQEVEGWSIPVSVGELRKATDQKNAASRVCDVIVSRQVFEEAREDPTGEQKDFLVGLALQYVEQKYKLRLDPRYKLPRLLYKYGLGEEDLVGALDAKTRSPDEAKPPRPVPMAQWVRDDAAAPKIEEVSGKPGAAAARARPAKAVPRNRGPLLPLESQLFLIWTDDLEAAEPAAWPTGPGDVVLLPAAKRRHRSDGGKLPRFLRLEVRGFRADALEEDRPLEDQIRVDASAFTVSVSAPGHRDLELHLPYSPNLTAGCEAELLDDLEAPQPGGHLLALTLACLLEDWEGVADSGSKAHLLACAIDSDGLDPSRATADAGAAAIAGPGDGASEAGAEDAPVPEAGLAERFHLRPKSVEAPAGAASNGGVGVAGLDLKSIADRPVTEDEELPEDRFHRADALSTHYISQRFEEKEARVKKAAEEKEARKDDENVEYIDLDDYKPGGKFGEAVASPTAGAGETEAAREARELQARATGVLEARVAEQAMPSPPEPTAQANKEAKVVGETGAGSQRVRLRNKLWTELL